MKFFTRTNILKSYFVSIILMLSFGLTGYCMDDAVLSSVTIEGNENSYNIILKTTLDTEVKTQVPSSDRLIIELKNTKTSELIKTSFIKAGLIDDVIVQPSGKDKTKLFISGNNVASSKVIIDSTNEPVIADQFAQDKIIQKSNKTIKNESQQMNNETTGVISGVKNTHEVEPKTVTENKIEKSNKPEVTKLTPKAESTTELEKNIIIERNIPQTNEDSLLMPEGDYSFDIAAPAPVKNQAPMANVKKQKTINVDNNNSKKENFLNIDSMTRFGFIFLLVTLLISYLRKENLLNFKPKRSMKKVNKEHLDIYQSLQENHNGLNNKSFNKNIVKLDRRKSSNTAKAANTIKNHNAMTGYTKQVKQNKASNRKLSNTITPTNTSRLKSNVNSLKYEINSGKTSPKNNIDFLKSMADVYEKSGRHDLAINIQKSIRKSTK